MTHTNAKNQGKKSVGSKDRKSGNRQTDTVSDNPFPGKPRLTRYLTFLQTTIKRRKKVSAHHREHSVIVIGSQLQTFLSLQRN